MSHPAKITTTLKDEHWEPFHELLADRTTTTDDARDWLQSRGYMISRTAVGNYRSRYRQRTMFTLRAELGCKGDTQTRRMVRTWMLKLEGAELTTLALFAAFLVNTTAAIQQVNIKPMEGLVPNDKRPR
jgi:hypothetical protein